MWVPAPMKETVEKKIVPPMREVSISGGALMASVDVERRIAKW